MWRLVLTVSLLCWSSEGSVTCRNNIDVEVDWYILYKAPKVTNRFTGLEYLYIDSNGMTKMESSLPDYKSIDHPTGVLANTLKPLFTSIRSMPQSFGFISYSDQPPGCSADQTFGHSKGVLMVDKDGTGVWLLHSTPQFPFRRNLNNFWPESGKKHAQTFICVTFPYAQFSKIGEHLQYIGAFPFEHDVPDDFYQELKDAVKWVKRPPSTEPKQLTSKKGLHFRSIAKRESKLPKDGDLYLTIANAVGSHVDVQTWGCQPGRAFSNCHHKYHVTNIMTINTDLGVWDPKQDHSKWCVAKDQNKHWTCIADVNRAISQYKRRGGALCIEHEETQSKFLRFAQGTEDCTSQNIMDIINTECDPDTDMTHTVPDTHMDLMG